VTRRNKCELDLLTDALYWASVLFDADEDYNPWFEAVTQYHKLGLLRFDRTVDRAEEDFAKGVRYAQRKKA
jgi:hypothetical protein